MSRTMSSREFNRDTAAAKRAAEDGPVIVTDRDRPAHVLLTWHEYRRLADRGKTPMELLAADGAAAEVELQLPPRELPRDPGLDW